MHTQAELKFQSQMASLVTSLNELDVLARRDAEFFREIVKYPPRWVDSPSVGGTRKVGVLHLSKRDPGNLRSEKTTEANPGSRAGSVAAAVKTLTSPIQLLVQCIDTTAVYEVTPLMPNVLAEPDWHGPDDILLLWGQAFDPNRGGNYVLASSLSTYALTFEHLCGLDEAARRTVIDEYLVAFVRANGKVVPKVINAVLQSTPTPRGVSDYQVRLRPADFPSQKRAHVKARSVTRASRRGMLDRLYTLSALGVGAGTLFESRRFTGTFEISAFDGERVDYHNLLDERPLNTTALELEAAFMAETIWLAGSRN